MKSTLAATALLALLIFLIGCKSTESSSSSSSSSGIPVRFEVKGGHGPLGDEAVKWATELWQPTKIGDSYYVFQTSPGKVITEFRTPLISVSPWRVSEADRLNGVEWRGIILVRIESYRDCYMVKDRFTPRNVGHWSEWKDGKASNAHVVSVELEKRNGKWAATGVTKGRTFKTVTQSDIPK